MDPWPPFTPAAVVLDLDGLLVDSEDAWGRIERQVVIDLGYAWDEAVRPLLLGRGWRDSARTLAAYVGHDDVEDLARRLLAAAATEFAAGAPVRPGAMELVTAVQGRVPLGVASSTVRTVAAPLLAPFAWALDAVVCGDDVTDAKPAPEPYLLACARLGVDPRRAVAFEDSPVGVAAAKAASLWTIGCPSSDITALTGADVVIPTLEGLRAPRTGPAAAVTDPGTPAR